MKAARTALHCLAATAAATAAAHLVPSVATIPWLHRRLAPALSGHSPLRHVALTFDDGPDPRATPELLGVLSDLDVTATFFVLGAQLEAHPELGIQLGEAGHEIGVHGWLHVPHLLRAPWSVARDLARTTELVRAVTATTPRFWRPPNGIISGGGLVAARRLGLRPVLWTADGRDWQARATPESITDRIGRQLARHDDGGGTVLLHDSDITSAPQSWRATLDAVPQVVTLCRERGYAIGPLGQHWPH